MTGYENLRIVRLFGKDYWWERLPDRRLALRRATWRSSRSAR